MKSVRVRTALAVSLFKDDSLSLGHAARLAGMALADFMRLSPAWAFLPSRREIAAVAR